MRDQINEAMNRRSFFGRGARGAGLLATAAAAAKFGAKVDCADSVNPFALNLDRVSKTDPNLLKYEEIARFAYPDTEPRRIRFGQDRHLYVASATQVAVLDLSGTVLRQVRVSAPARCVSCAPDGTIYAGLQDHVEVFSAGGDRLASWDIPGPRTWFSGIAASDKDVFVADSGNRVVLRYDRSGKVIGRIGQKNKEKSVPGLVMPSPYMDVVLGKDGLLRVNNFGRHCVEVYTPEGDLELSWGKPTAAIDGFCGCCNPVSVALLPGGGYVTCEKGLPRVKVYSDKGEFVSVVAGVESFPENAKALAVSKGLDCNLGGLDATVDDQGRVYVLDLVAANIRVLRAKA